MNLLAGATGFLGNEIIDTLKLARKEFPNQSVSLDSLCRKYNKIYGKSYFYI